MTFDPAKKQLAQKARLHMKICFSCGARNSMALPLDVENAVACIYEKPCTRRKEIVGYCNFSCSMYDSRLEIKDHIAKSQTDRLSSWLG